MFLSWELFENALRKLEDVSTDYSTLGSSRFTIPVSVIVAAYNEEGVIASTVRSFLEFDYPEFEVVVVNDGSSDETLEQLRQVFELEPYQVFVRHVFPSAPVRPSTGAGSPEPRGRRQGERRQGRLAERC